MKQEVVIWVDPRKAVIVTIVKKIAKTRNKLSEPEKHVRFSSSIHKDGSGDEQGSPVEIVRDRQFDNHPQDFYDAVIASIRNAEMIWIFGIGEAKTELKNHLRQAGIAAGVVGIEPVEKMPTPQISSIVQVQNPG